MSEQYQELTPLPLPLRLESSSHFSFSVGVITDSVKIVNSKLLKQMAIILLGGSLCAGCQPGTSTQPSSASTNEFRADFDLLDGVDAMWGGYVDAMNSGAIPRDGEIPSRYWSDPIKALHPIKVYSDVGNTVVVQKIDNGIEYGKYITPPTSSHTAEGDFILSRSDTNYVLMSDYQKRVIPK